MQIREVKATEMQIHKNSLVVQKRPRRCLDWVAVVGYFMLYCSKKHWDLLLFDLLLEFFKIFSLKHMGFRIKLQTGSIWVNFWIRIQDNSTSKMFTCLGNSVYRVYLTFAECFVVFCFFLAKRKSLRFVKGYLKQSQLIRRMSKSHQQDVSWSCSESSR